MSCDDLRKWVNLRDNSSILNFRMCDKKGLKFRRRYLKALVFDYLLEPINNEDLIVIVDITNVTSVQPSILINGVLCCSWIIQITCRS